MADGLLGNILKEQRAGVLGKPAAAVEEVTTGGNAGGGGVLAALTSLFGGSNDPNLTEEQNQSASRQARLRAGLQGLILSSRGDAGLTEILATAALTGQEAGAQFRTDQLTSSEELERRARVQELLDSGMVNVDILQGILNDALLRGDTKTVTSLTEILKSINSGVESPNFIFKNVADPDDPTKEIIVAFDKNDPTAPGIKIGDTVPKASLTSRTFTKQHDVTLNGETFTVGTASDGVIRRVPVDPALDGMVKANTRSDSTRDRVLSAVVGNAELFDIITGTAPPNFLEDMLIKVGLPDFVGEEQQKLDSVGEIISRTYVFMLSGVTARETEVKAAKKIFMPQRGNKPEVLRIKRLAARRLETILLAIVNNTASGEVLTALQAAKGGTEAEIEALMKRIANGDFEETAAVSTGLTGRPTGG